jgi:hypothetical protein
MRISITLAALLLLAAQSASRPAMITVSSQSPERNAELTALIADIRSQADAFVFLSGGASRMSPEHQSQLLAMFQAFGTIAREGRRIAVGDGGTQAGIMQAAGDARHASGGAFPLIGISPAGEVQPRGKTPVDPNHSHIVAVNDPAAPPGDAWGTETSTMYWLFAELARGRPSVTVVANGGPIALKEVEANVRAGRRMILIAGSGRATDAIISLLAGSTPTNEEVLTLRKDASAMGLTKKPELFTQVPLSAGAAGLRTAILQALDAQK